MAIRLDIYPDSNWDIKPPNGLVEHVFDEFAIKDCTGDPPLNEAGEPPKPRLADIHVEIIEGARAELIRKNMANARARGKAIVWPEPPGLALY